MNTRILKFPRKSNLRQRFLCKGSEFAQAILAGIEPDGLSIAKLTEQPIPEDWNEQRRLYGFSER